MLRFSTLVAGALLFGMTPPGLAQTLERSVLIVNGGSLPGAGNVTGIAEEMSFDVAPAGFEFYRRACISVVTDDGRNPLVLYDVDSGEILYGFDSTTVLATGQKVQIQLGCAINQDAVVVAGLLDDFVTQAYIVQRLLPDGSPDGLPEILLQSGDALPNMATFSQASPVSMNSSGFAFGTDATNGLYYFDLASYVTRYIAGISSTYPGTPNNLSVVSQPRAGESTIGFSASGLGGETGALQWDIVTTALDEAVAYSGFETAPYVAAVDGVDRFSWFSINSLTFEGEIYEFDGDATNLIVPSRTYIIELDEDMIPIDEEFYVTVGINLRGLAAEGACVGYSARAASDPFGPLHLVRSCETADGSRESVLLLSEGDVIDDATVASWVISPEAAAGTDVVLLAYLADGGSAVIHIGDARDTDSDGDGVADTADNCVQDVNPDQRDTDGDLIGNICDPDVALPNDCLVNFADLSVYKANFLAAGDLDTDNNGDGVTNFTDLSVVKSAFLGPPGPSAAGCN